MKPNQHAVQVAIEVPSGKLVFGNSFTDLFDEPTPKRKWCDTSAEEKELIKEYAKQGLLRGFVGNSCPGIYRQGDSLIIGNDPRDKDYNRIPTIQGQIVGGVVTDAYTYCAADQDLFLARGGNVGRGISVVDVMPGRYVLSHFCSFNQEDFYPFCEIHAQSGEPTIFATIQRSDEPVVELHLPEEELEDKLKSLAPDSTWHEIKVLRIYEQFALDLEYTKEEGQGTAHLYFDFTAEQIKNDNYLAEKIREAKEKYEREDKFIQDCLKSHDWNDQKHAEVRRILESRCAPKRKRF
ncbi:hypothetical protein HZA97_07770 [Candidatus Woesearchaeota archaeon]|nr:hypothetical protein [Candidatus Woesearchaeota archaeon]